MRKTFLLGALALLACPVIVCGGQVNEIVLEDGSLIRAEVLSLADGTYTLRSDAMGTFSLDASRVNQIRRPGSAVAAGVPAPSFAQPSQSLSGAGFNAQVQSTRELIMRDPQAMQEISGMTSDPAFKALLDDPEAVAALKSGDTATLLRNPRFQAIMNNPRMQGIASNIVTKTQNE